MSKHANDFDYLGLAHRIRVTRLTLGISEQEAAKATGCTLQTWRKWETTGEGRLTCRIRRFADRYDVSLDWLVAGDGGAVGDHLFRTQGNLAILPAKGPRHLRAEQTYASMGIRPELKTGPSVEQVSPAEAVHCETEEAPSEGFSRQHIDNVHSKAFTDMEGEVYDLDRAGEIARDLIMNCRAREDDLHNLELAVFAVGQFADMAKAFRTNYQKRWYGERVT